MVKLYVIVDVEWLYVGYDICHEMLYVLLLGIWELFGMVKLYDIVDVEWHCWLLIIMLMCDGEYYDLFVWACFLDNAMLWR